MPRLEALDERPGLLQPEAEVLEGADLPEQPHVLLPVRAVPVAGPTGREQPELLVVPQCPGGRPRPLRQFTDPHVRTLPFRQPSERRRDRR